MDLQELNGRRVLVVGFGVTGSSVVRYLQANDIEFDVADQCDENAAHSLASQINGRVASISPEHEPVDIENAHVPLVFNRFESGLFSRYPVIVLSPGIPRSSPALVDALAKGVDIIGDIELFAGAVQAPVIAVTGSNGKSTVVSWIASALQGAGIKALACGNIGRPALDSLEDSVDVYVLELSSYQLESTRSLKPLSAAVLNVSDDHLDRYDDIEHYAAVKRRVYKGASNCIANLDDARTWPEASAESVVEYFSLSLEADTGARWHRSTKEGQWWLCDDQYRLLDQAQLSIPGEHNVANALTVLALIEPLEVPFTALAEGLTRFGGLPHRGQFIGERAGVRWFNDSKGTNIDACSKAVQAMPGPVLLIAGGISKGADFSQLHGVVEKFVLLLVLIGQDRDQIAAQLKDASEIVMADDLQQAVAICKHRARSGDVVLLSPACSSFDMFKNFEDRGDQFVAAVQEVLAA
ncbi:MAG: UDP-N-acetylmuramoyl-L-alanine--D-glutamate ligase [Granulosicoccus sp.]